MTSHTLVLATANAKKVKEMREILAPYGEIVIRSAADFEITEPEETGVTFAANAELKAIHYAERTGLPCLADDSGLVVDALDGRPGVFSSRYAPTDDERIARLLGELAEVPDNQRTARFECAMCLAGLAGDGMSPRVIATQYGTLEGKIAHERRGEYGFGYDPIFYVPQLGCQLAEAKPEQKNAISHRGLALQKMLPIILETLGIEP